MNNKLSKYCTKNRNTHFCTLGPLVRKLGRLQYPKTGQVTIPKINMNLNSVPRIGLCKKLRRICPLELKLLNRNCLHTDDNNSTIPQQDNNAVIYLHHCPCGDIQSCQVRKSSNLIRRKNSDHKFLLNCNFTKPKEEIKC